MKRWLVEIDGGGAIVDGFDAQQAAINATETYLVNESTRRPIVVTVTALTEEPRTFRLSETPARFELAAEIARGET